MADRFNLTAQLQLQAPTNTRQVVNQIRSQLQGVTVNVQVQANARAIGQVNAGLQATTRQANDAARSVGFLNRNLSEAARRFGVITLATGTMLSFAQSVKRAVGEAIAFERELVRIAQTTGKSVRELSDLSNEVTKLATSLGVSSSSLLSTANVLAQAGFSAKTTKQALDILAKTTLGPTFDDVTETVEGAVSVLSQFRQEAIAAGGDIKFLESTLDAINSVSKAFAVESSDLITVIRRTGGVFAAAGGSVNELIALFTSVRATTRESAETIATGLRTIFTRIQRTDTVNQLEQLGISLRDAEGNFVGAFEAVKRLSVGLSAIDPRNYRFSQIVEELGGFRQIGKVIPLIQQFVVAQDALNVAQSASGSVAEDALTAQQSLAVQAIKVREEFSALIRTLTNSETFRGIAAGALELARALIKIGEALEPVLPLLTSLLALKIGQGLAPGLAAIAGFGGGRRRGAAFGGVVRGFARGGYVPGSGNRDTVPAMLQPGEFVIRKSSAEKLGPSTLTAMNENKFKLGGVADPKNSLERYFADSSSINLGLADSRKLPKEQRSLLAADIKNLRKLRTQAPEKLYSSISRVAFDRMAAQIGLNKDLSLQGVKLSDQEKLLSQEAAKTQGKTFNLPGFVSTSKEFSKAKLFLDNAPRAQDNWAAMLSIATKKNAQGIDVESQLSGRNLNLTKQDINPRTGKMETMYMKPPSSEKEVVLQPRSRFRINNARVMKLGAEKNFWADVQQYKRGGIAEAPLVDDILQTTGAILPKPSSALQSLISAGGGAVDIDRTLKRTIGDKAYMKARTKGEQTAVLEKYFKDPKERLADIKSAQMTQFGKELQTAIRSGELKANTISIVSKSQRTPGVAEYLNKLFGIPVQNMIFTQGGSKQSAMDAIRTKGPRIQRVKKMMGGKIDVDNNTFERFEDGGGVRRALTAERKAKLTISPEKDLINKGVGILKLAEQQADIDTYAGAFLRPEGNIRNLVGENENLLNIIQNTSSYKAIERATSGATRGGELSKIKKLTDETISNKYAKKNKYNLIAGGLDNNVSNNLEDTLLNGVVQTITSGVSVLEQQLGITGDLNTARALKQSNIDQTIGNLFESVLTFGGAPYEDNRESANAPFDFKSGLGAVASKFNIPNNIPTDAKTTLADDNLKSLMKKVNNQNALEAEMDLDPILSRLASLFMERGSKAEAKEIESARKVKAFFGGRIGKYANGGNVDTVPSLLTPGEFVINKKSAQSIGYSNLHRMNQTGVSKFNTGGIVGVQKFANGGSVFSGATTFETPDYNLVQKAISGNVKAYNDLEAAQKQQIKLAYDIIKAQDPLIPRSRAYAQAQDQVTQQWGTLYKDLQNSSAATKTFSQKLQQNFPILTSIGGGIASRVSSVVGGREGLQAGAQRLGDISGAAQQFAFLAGSAAALGSQFSGLNETTSKAISETAAYTASLVGVGGTVVQMFTSLFTSGVQQTTSTNINSVAQQQCAAATTQNATSQSAAANAGVGLAQGFALGAAAAILVSSGFKYLAATAKAEADNLKKAADGQLEAIERGIGSINTFADSIAKATQKSIEALANEAAASTALTAGLAASAAGAAAGAGVGFFFGGPAGAALGAAIGGITLGLLGASTGLISYRSELAKQQAIAAKFGVELERSAQGLGILTAAQSRFEQSLQDIEVAGLKPEEQVSRRLVTQTSTAGINKSEFDNAQSSLSKALFELAKQTGKSINELTEADFKKFPALANVIDISRQTISRATDGLAKDVAESRKTLQEAAKLELTGDVSLDQILKDPANQLTQALQANEAAILAETQARLTSLQKSLTAAKNDEERVAIGKQVNDEQKRYEQRIKDGRESLRRQAEEAEKNKKALARASAAQEAYRQELLKISTFTNALVSTEQNLNKLEQALGNLNNYISGDAFDVSRMVPIGLDDLSQVGDRGVFENVVNNITSDLGPAGQLLANKVITTSKAIDIANRELTNVEFGQGFTSDEFLNRLGIDKNMLGGAKEKFEKAFEEAMIDGKITEEEMKQLLEPIESGAKESADALKKAVSIQNKELSLYQNYLGQLQQQRDKEVAARQSLTDILLKGAELRAEARGQKLTPERREAFRQQRAQQGLQGITDITGKQLVAGDVAGVSTARLKADQERINIQQRLKAPDVGDKERKQLIAKDRELANVVAKTTDELNRLTDQSSRASDILGEIDKERGKRETLTGIIEDFVVGGGDQRQAINEAFAGIQSAISTGTLQNQTPEQRKATVDMLDKLSDFELPGAGGLTGKEVKQRLIFQDAIKMGLDPKIADQLSKATSKEEKLIDALDRLTKQMQDAGQANVDLEEQRRRNIEAQAPEVVPRRAPPIPPKGAPIPSAPPPAPVPIGFPEPPMRTPLGGIYRYGQIRTKRKAQFEEEMQRRRDFYEASKAQRRAAAGISEPLPFGGMGGGMFQVPPEQLIPRQQQAQQNMVNIAGAVAPQQQMSAIPLDTMQLSGVFNNFLGNFSGVFDNIVKTFSGLQASFTTLAQSMSGMTMEHHVNVEGLISVGGLNLEAIKSELSTSIGQMVAMEVQKSMDEQRKTFRAG